MILSFTDIIIFAGSRKETLLYFRMKIKISTILTLFEISIFLLYYLIFLPLLWLYLMIQIYGVQEEQTMFIGAIADNELI